jgi:lysine/ornithine N-monooxygenase
MQPHDDSDLLSISTPMTLFKRIGSDAALKLQPNHQHLLDGLQAAGFKIIDDDELLPTFLALTIHRAGGFYIDVGCSGLIAAGKIHHKFGHEITQFNKNSVTFADGEEMEADEVVFATGYANGRTRTRKIFGDSVADRIEQIWGFDKQGEIRGVWRRSGHEDFWVAAGSLWLSRYYSRLLALQIKMIEEGLVEV